MKITTINKLLVNHGVELIRGKGYFYFLALETGEQIGESVYVNSLNQQTEARWVLDAVAAINQFALENEERSDRRTFKSVLPKYVAVTTAIIHHIGLARGGEVATKTFVLTGRSAGLPLRDVANLLFEKDNAPFEVPGCFLYDFTGRPYSMSVGDVIEFNGQYILCDSFGWKEVSKEDFLTYTGQK